MEVAIPFSDNFDFNSARSTPFTSPPSTPKPFDGNFYFSAPSSPSHISQFYREFDCLYLADDDEKVEISSSHVADDFAFDVSQELVKGSVSAEELFDSGMIKPLLKSSPVSPVLQNRGTGSLEISVEKTGENRVKQRESRGKQRVLSTSSSRRTARSLSPMRNSQYEEEDEKPTSILCTSISKGSKKWRFKDFFLFRSASEGRASDKDPLKKYYRRSNVEGKSSSNKGNDGPVVSSSKSIVTTRRKKGQVSAHELHYIVNRAVSSDLKKKTLLPYKQGIFGQLAFNPAVHALAKGFGLSKK